MFHLHSSFDLAPGVDPAAFRGRWAAFVADMRSIGLVERSSPVARRVSETPLDTDAARAQKFFAVISFRDRAQADAAYAHIEARIDPAQGSHNVLLAGVTDPVFSCWEDPRG